jgi:excisionase family DNA binding protein
MTSWKKEVAERPTEKEFESLEYYSIAEVAKIIGLCTKTVYGYARSGKIHAVKIGRSWKITADEVKRITTEGVIVE